MRIRKHRNKNGGAAIFLCIVLSAVILTESVLFCASGQRAAEAELYRCLHLQSSQILCRYNESLLKNYGIYAFDASAVGHTVFDTCFAGSDKTTLTITPAHPLTSAEVLTGVSDFMKIRIPAIAADKILTGIKGMYSQIQDSGIAKKTGNADATAWIGYLKEYLSGKDTWSSILGNAASFIQVVDFTGKCKDLEDFATQYRNIIESDATQYLQGDAETSYQDTILQPDSISDMLSNVDSMMNSQMPDLVDSLLFNAYSVSFLDSEISTIDDGDTQTPEKNILGVPFSEVHAGNHADLEYLITGIDYEPVSCGAVKVAVYDLRTLLDFGSSLLDSDKMKQAEGIAEVVSIVLAALTLGTVSIDPEIIKYIVLYVMAVGQALSDMSVLLSGGSIPLMDLTVISDIPALNEWVMTDFRDYLGIFLLFIPQDWKLSRLLSILKRDCGSYLYCGVQLDAEYLGHGFSLEDSYDVYS